MSSEKKNSDVDNKNYEVLPEDYSSYDLSFKIIVIGNSGNIIIYK